MTIQINDNAEGINPYAGMSPAQLSELYYSYAPAGITPQQQQQEDLAYGQLKGKGRDQIVTTQQYAAAGLDPNGRKESPQQQQMLWNLQESGETNSNGSGWSFNHFMSVATPIVTAAGLGAAFGPAVGALVGGGGAVATGATTGAITGASGAGLTGQNVAKGAVVGGLTGGLTAAASPYLNSLADNTGLSQALVNGVAKKAIGLGVGDAANAAFGSGQQGNNNMAINPGTGTNLANAPITSNGGGGALQTGLGLGTTLLGTIGNYQNAQAAGNVLSNAQAGTGIGTSYGYKGPGSTSSYGNGQINTQLNGGLGVANTQLGNFAGQQSGIANSFNGQLPANIQTAINSQAQQRAPTGTQGQLQNQNTAQLGVQGNQQQLMNTGQQQLNNPLTANFQQAAQKQLGTAGQDFNTTYQNSLSSLNQALALPTQQAEAQMANQQFGRGQLGTTGGALQTQAFATGLGQAYLGNQQTALNEAMNAQNSATSNAATLNSAGSTNLQTANSLLANAYGQFNNTSQLNANTANSIFGQNSTISQLGNQYGQQNLNNQITGAATPAQLAGAYGQNANQAVAGATGLNNIGLSGFNAALSAGTQQGQQYNNAIGNAARIVAPSYGQTGGNGLGAIGSGLNSIFGGNGVASGVGNALGSLFGGGASTDTSSGYATANQGLSDFNNSYSNAGTYDGSDLTDLSGWG